jgi:hypothetical protein
MFITFIGLRSKIMLLPVTAIISSKDRYHSTLSMAISSILCQNEKPNQFILYDDGEQRDLRSDDVYKYLFGCLDFYGISWMVVFGERKGQVANHQKSIEQAQNNLIYRIDDDDVLEANTLSELYKTITSNENIGAVGGLVLRSDNPIPKIKRMPDGRYTDGNEFYSNDIKHILDCHNIQWAIPESDELIHVDHLYNSFLFRKSATKGYPMFLSKVGHREETIFSYEMKRSGFDIIINPKAISWHHRQYSGGIADEINNTSYESWYSDERIFKKIYTQDWGLQWKDEKRDGRIILLDNGIGDHFAFKPVLPKLVEKYGSVKVYAFYPDVFYDVDKDTVAIYPIHEFDKTGYSRDTYNIYAWMGNRRWTKSLTNAFEEMYL